MSDMVSNGYLKDKNGNVMEIVDKAARDGVERLTEEIERQTYNTVAEMIEDADLSPGLTVCTSGYFVAGDGGDGEYIISDSVEANGLDIIALNNGLCAVLQHNGHIRARQCGVPDDDKTSTKFMEMWDHFNGVAESIDINVYRAYTNKTLVLNDVTEVFSSDPARQNINWNGGDDNAVITVIDGNGTIFDSPKPFKQRIRLHDLYVVAENAKVGVNLMYAIGMRNVIDRVFVLGGGFGFVFGSNWTCSIGELNATYQNIASYYTMPNWSTEYFDITPLNNTFLDINAVTIRGLYCGTTPRGVWFEPHCGDININVISVEDLTSEDGIAVKFGAVSGTINAIHIESDQKVHAYDLYVDTHNEDDTPSYYEDGYFYKAAHSLNINEVRGRRFYLNGNVTIGALSVIQWVTNDYTNSPLLFEGGRHANEVNILYRPSSFYLDNIDMPYGFCGAGYEYFKTLPTMRRLENLLLLGESEVYSESVDSSAAVVKTVPANAAQWAEVKKVYGHTSDRPFTQLVQNPDATLDVNAAQSGVDIAVGRKFYANHKYLFAYSHTGTADGWMSIGLYERDVAGLVVDFGYLVRDDAHDQYYAIGEATKDVERISADIFQTGNIYFYTDIRNGTGTNFQVYDLTAIYGAGNEPTTLAEFREDYPLLNYADCENELKHAAVQEIVTSAGDTLYLAHTLMRFRGYGQSYGEVKNYCDLENGVFHRYGYYKGENEWVEDEKEFSIGYALLPRMIHVKGAGTITFVVEDGFGLTPASDVAYMVKPETTV